MCPFFCLLTENHKRASFSVYLQETTNANRPENVENVPNSNLHALCGCSVHIYTTEVLYFLYITEVLSFLFVL